MKINKYAKSFKAMMLTLFLGVSSTLAFAQVGLPENTYCGAIGTPPNTGAGCSISGSTAAINGVVTKGGITNINNQNTGCGVNGNNVAYTDYTTSGMIVTQDAGKAIDVEITYKGGVDADKTTVKIYVDWNRDGDFEDEDEFIAPFGWKAGTPYPHTINNAGGKLTIKVTVPGHAKEGPTRMRIINGSLFKTAQSPEFVDSCSNGFAEGEAEDYVLEAINPCLPPNVISIASLGDNDGEFAWTKKPNAEFYEYVIKRDPTPPPSLGYHYTTDTKVEVDTFECDTKYYIFVRCICDTVGRTAAIWKRSDWQIDSFTTHACCEEPDVTVDKINGAAATARISWPPVFSSIGYEYVVTTSETPPSSGGTYTQSNVVVLRGLDFNKRYYVFVRSRCNPTPLSGWTKVNFKSGKYASVDDLNHQSFTMDAYPNPMLDNVVVKLSGTVGNNAKLTVVDITGKIVHNSSVKGNEINVNTSNFPSGIYILKYSDDTHNEVMRVTKK